jgi:hypothetical protein
MRVALMVCMLSLSACHAGRSVNVYDGFEAASLSKVWTTTKFVPGAVEIQAETVRAGKSAARITLHEGDRFEAGDEKSLPSERAELTESADFWALEDVSYVYSFSLFIPQDFPIVPTRLVLAQWKQRCPQTQCEPDNPLIALRYATGELRITRQAGPQSTVLYRTRDELRNKWLDFRFEIRFSRRESGHIKVWLNKTAILNYTGVTAYPEAGGYPSQNRFYFKMGLYRDRMAEPMTIYVDEYRKEQLP